MSLAPRIDDLATGVAFLNRLPLAMPAAAQAEIERLLDGLLEFPPDAEDLFQLLEQARVPLRFVSDEISRQYHNKPIPLPEPEEQALQQVLSCWQKMERAYALCAERGHAAPDDPAYAVRIASILHRCIHYSGNLILEHFRARRELPAGLWLHLHGYYATAEEWEVAHLPVADPLDAEQQATHCTAAYLTLILIDAGSPYSRSVRDLDLIHRWAARWAPLVSIQPLTDDIEIPPFIIELMKDSGMHPTAYDENSGGDTRQLDTSRLTLQIQQTLVQLKQRITPSQLGLGEETASHVGQLLIQLARPWALSAAARRFRRFPSTGTARLASGFEPIYFFVAGSEFEQPDAAATYKRTQFDNLFTFRDQVDPQRKPTVSKPPEYPVDVWDVINHSAQGFRLGRSAAGQRMAHGQLLAVCPDDSDAFILAQASWLQQEASGGLIAGLALFPGRPKGVAVRHAAPGTTQFERFFRAFLLPPLPALDEESTLIVPLGTYKASQELEISDDGLYRVRMRSLRHRGCDFERITFEKI